MLRVPNGVANRAQVNVFQLDVVVTQIDDFARDGVVRIGSTRRGSTACCFFFRSCAHNGSPIGILRGIVVPVAWTLRIGTQNGADARQRGVQLGVFVHHIDVAAPLLMQRRVRNHDVVNCYGAVFVAAVSAVIHNFIGLGQTNVVHVATAGTEMHFFV